jgi:hypothetical protein
MLIKEMHLQSDLEILRHGGKEAIAVFMKISKCLLASDTDDALKSWITIAAPALPEAERGEILLFLMSAFLHVSHGIPMAQHASSAVSTKTIH